jgi:hypothetical protein
VSDFGVKKWGSCLLVGSCEHGNEHLDSMKVGKFVEQPGSQSSIGPVTVARLGFPFVPFFFHIMSRCPGFISNVPLFK